MRPENIVPKLLAWFAANARALPWRRTRDPYGIWVSEIMLQQTQVKTVIPYWERWMRALPDIAALARADSQVLHKLWEGLGYYTRVRNLQKAAQVILRQHGGRFPNGHEQVLALPGIGRYTAGAICSMAFNQPTPILDGNVTRVLARVYGIDGNVREAATREALWDLAGNLVAAAADVPAETWACSRLNQALMELGAVVCTPRKPRCGVCPLARQCAARRQNRVGQLPNLPLRAPATRRRFAAFVVRHGDRLLVRQRPAGVVNAHLWEFPNTEIKPDALDPAGAAYEATNLRAKSLWALGTVRHSIMRYRITVEVFAMRCDGRRPRTRAGEWRSRAELFKLPFSSAHKRILALASDGKLESASKHPAAHGPGARARFKDSSRKSTP